MSFCFLLGSVVMKSTFSSSIFDLFQFEEQGF